ncbi:unnamed protein product [Amoebophrya sp. A25]|nr:unnamed protein product [Amoebophrya sp. A25]|eukprot:GSA25T00017224001.1
MLALLAFALPPAGVASSSSGILPDPLPPAEVASSSSGILPDPPFKKPVSVGRAGLCIDDSPGHYDFHTRIRSKCCYHSVEAMVEAWEESRKNESLQQSSEVYTSDVHEREALEGVPTGGEQIYAERLTSDKHGSVLS